MGGAQGWVPGGCGGDLDGVQTGRTDRLSEWNEQNEMGHSFGAREDCENFMGWMDDGPTMTYSSRG